jgi:hypothetical protein
MAHGLIKATIIPEIIRLIMEKYSVSEEKALDMFYTSAALAHTYSVVRLIYSIFLYYKELVKSHCLRLLIAYHLYSKNMMSFMMSYSE